MREPCKKSALLGTIDKNEAKQTKINTTTEFVLFIFSTGPFILETQACFYAKCFWQTSKLIRNKNEAALILDTGLNGAKACMHELSHKPQWNSSQRVNMVKVVQATFCDLFGFFGTAEEGFRLFSEVVHQSTCVPVASLGGFRFANKAHYCQILRLHSPRENKYCPTEKIILKKNYL